MKLDLKLVLRAGIIWGIIGVLLVLAVRFLGNSVPFIPEDPLMLGVYASLFGGVYFAYKNTEGNVVVSVIGGAVSGIIVALLMFAVGYLVSAISFDLSDAATATGLFGALVAGLFGALAVEIIKRV